MMIKEIAMTFTNRELMTELLNTSGKRTERLRKDKGWNQEDLAKAVSVRQNYISAIENDKAAPSADVMAAIAKELDTTLDFLMLLTDKAEKPEDAKPTFISTEAEQAAHIIDLLLPEERQRCLGAVQAVQKEHELNAELGKLFEYLFGLIRDLGGPEYILAVEREVGARAPFLNLLISRSSLDQFSRNFRHPQ